MRIISIIPVSSESKRVKDKNIKKNKNFSNRLLNTSIKFNEFLLK
jgi:CMP-N-acetylneuraminic acid synthetase